MCTKVQSPLHDICWNAPFYNIPLHYIGLWMLEGKKKKRTQSAQSFKSSTAHSTMVLNVWKAVTRETIERS